MSAATAPALAFDRPPQRIFQRHPINTTLDLIALRSGVPETLPGRCTDISEAGVGAVVAGELIPGQQVALELRLPNVGLPIRVRALVSYQTRLRCGLEFIGLAPEQREMIRYWMYRATSPSLDFKYFNEKTEEVADSGPVLVPLETEPRMKTGRKIRVVRRGLYVLLVCTLALAGVGWLQWQKSWDDLERRAPGVSGLRTSPEAESSEIIPPEVMQKRIVAKAEPQYPELARNTGTQGMVVLGALIGPEGNVKRLWPVSGPDLLVQSASDAVQSWRFRPYISGGRAIDVETTIAVDFRLN
jgi:TonB family protein